MLQGMVFSRGASTGNTPSPPITLERNVVPPHASPKRSRPARLQPRADSLRLIMRFRSLTEPCRPGGRTPASSPVLFFLVAGCDRAHARSDHLCRRSWSDILPNWATESTVSGRGTRAQHKPHLGQWPILGAAGPTECGSSLAGRSVSLNLVSRTLAGADSDLWILLQRTEPPSPGLRSCVDRQPSAGVRPPWR